MSCDLENYDCADKGLLMPFVNEYTWAHGFRAVVYGIGLLWSFMAVSIIADIFMAGIETITTKTQKLQIANPEAEDGVEEIEVEVWNGTVANLTLMALGSSAPEIMLSIIEVFKNSFYAGDLGPGTIVGSAAFNLMCITGVCIMAIPKDEVRRIKHIKVFVVTAVFSVIAYIWLIIILTVTSPDYVDVWEAVVTMLMLPAMVVLAYIADKDYCGKKPDEESSSHLDLELKPLPQETEAVLKGEKLPEGVELKADKKLILEFVKKMKHEKGYSEKDVASLVAHVMNKEMSHSRAWYRRNAIKNMTGAPKLDQPLDSHTKELLETMLMAEDTTGSQTSLFYKEEDAHKAIVEFAAPSVAVLEKDKRVKVTLMRRGNLTKQVVFNVETYDGTAEAESDYIPIKKSMVFKPNQTTQDLEIEIIDDNVWEPDEVFFVKLSIDPDQPGMIGRRQITQVVILNDDDPGTIQFEKPSFLFKESIGTACIPVVRENGADGELRAKWRTKDLSAVAGKDYENSQGEIVFQHGECTKNIEIIINDDLEFEKDENFEVILESVTTQGAKLGRLKRTIVTIVNDDEFNGFVSRIANLTNANLDAMRVQRASWGKQFVEAMNVNGGNLETATILDYVMHFFTFGWKLIFALVPPPSIWGGWLTFIVGLVFMGVLTALIGDLASIFGCLIGLKDAVTAITFVALGTSLPDLFASKTAATREKTADNSIGNVTGSNGVNVFLGIGLAWFVSSCYWTAQGKTFEVPAGNLGFSVVVFTCCALTTIAILMVRRYVKLFGGELGGPKVPKLLCGIGLILLWIFYVLMASMQVYGYIKGF